MTLYNSNVSFGDGKKDIVFIGKLGTTHLQAIDKFYLIDVV